MRIGEKFSFYAWASDPRVISSEQRSSIYSREICELQRVLGETIGCALDIPWQEDDLSEKTFLITSCSDDLIPGWWLAFLSIKVIWVLLHLVPRTSRHQRKRRRLQSNERRLEFVHDDMVRMKKAVEEAMGKFPDYENHGFFRNKEGDLFYLTAQIEGRHPKRILAIQAEPFRHLAHVLTVEYKSAFGGGISYYFVSDIVVHGRDSERGNHYGKGAGTYLLRLLRKFAEKNNVDRIEGTLSFVDMDDHPERLERFYRKNGWLFMWDPQAPSRDKGKVWIDFKTCGPTRPISDFNGGLSAQYIMQIRDQTAAAAREVR